MIEQLLPYLLQGAGGAVLGPILARLVGGRGFGTLGNVIAGVLGGVGAGQGLDMAGVDLGSMLGGGDAMRLLAEVLQGGVGGGVLGGLAGVFRRK